MIDERCKDCSLFLELQELKKMFLEQQKEIDYEAAEKLGIFLAASPVQ